MNINIIGMKKIGCVLVIISQRNNIQAAKRLLRSNLEKANAIFQEVYDRKGIPQLA